MYICLCVCLSIWTRDRQHGKTRAKRQYHFQWKSPAPMCNIFCGSPFFPQKFCTFSATLNKCNFWGTFWPERCVQECYSLSMSVCVSTSEHESASMEKHVHDIDWSWMRHFLNPTLSIVWWSSIPYKELNYTKNFNNEGNLISLFLFRIWFKMVYLVRD